MLTIATISPKQAEEYYQQENYYSKEAAQKNSEWWGRGAVTLGLNGSITDNEVYRNVINGLSPDGKQKLRGKPKIKGFIPEETQTPSKVKPSKKQKKQPKERAGIDLTFSAPKSVSVACLVGGDKQLEEAHLRAVKRTLEFIEKYYPQTRIKGQRVQTDNLIVAMWHHYLSRELDPHLHTHCILMNATQLVNGTWQSRTDENLYYNKILLGRIYRQELALECQKLGYEIESHPQELFEIKGYSREQIDAFSKRHEQIVKYLEQREIDITTESKVWAWRRTRIKKNSEIDRNEMLRYWHEEANLYGVVHPVPVPKVVNKEAIAAQLQSATAASVEHCSERKVAFKKEEIIKFVMAEIKPFGIDELERAIEQHPELIKTYDGRVTTQTALSRELGTIKLMHQGKGQVSPIAHSEVVESYLEGKKLTSGQREAIALAATTNNQFITWQGVAGAGKTYALNELKQITEVFKNVAQGYNIKGFAPSAEAARVLGSELGIEVNTVASLLASKQSENIQTNQIWIVDEAGMLSAKDAYALLYRATDEQARVILVGDTRQLSAVEAGNPFKSLQQAGIQTAYLNEPLRQKPPDLQKAVSLAAEGHIQAALAHLEQVGRIEELADAQARTTRIAQEYIKLLPEERQNTLILAGTHKERLAIIQQIRAALKQEGTLGYGVEATQLRVKDLTSVQSRYTHHYQVGDVVVPVRTYRRLGLHKSQPYVVEAIAKEQLILSDLVGNRLAVNPLGFRKTVYAKQTIEIAVGDRLKWTLNDKELGHRNGQEFVVTSIEGQTVTIEYFDSKTERIHLTQPLHLDYALVSTTYSSQGKTADRVLVSSTVDRTLSQESFYVAISRAKHDLQIFAQDREFLFEQAQESHAQETVLELLPVYEPSVERQQVAISIPVVEKPAATVTATFPLSPSTPVPDQPATTVTVTPLLRSRPKSVTPKPKPVKAFWIPGTIGESPTHIEPNHWRELVGGSAIHPAIAARNFRSLQTNPIEQEHEAWEYLMYSDKLERNNTGRLSTGMLNRYAHLEAGGWWCSAGVDSRCFKALQPGQKPNEKIWGCYKPNDPRDNLDKPGKKIKYEHPPKTDLSVFLLDVPQEIADRIYQKEEINPTMSDRASGFWYCVWKYNLPIIITEGAKKAASLLSQGYAAIGLPGIYAGYRSKDKHGNPIEARLHEELAVFATEERQIKICFDYETRPETKTNIDIAISRTGYLLQQQGAKVSVINLLGPEKGVDDLIVARGPLAYEKQEQRATRLRERQQTGIEQQLTARLVVKTQAREPNSQTLNLQPLEDNGQARHHPNWKPDLAPQVEQLQFKQQACIPDPAALSQLPIKRKQTEVSHEDTAFSTQQSAGINDTNRNRTGEIFSSSCTKIGAVRNQPYQFTTGTRELSEGISRIVEQQEVERLTRSIAALNQSLTNFKFSNTGATKRTTALRTNFEQLHSAIGQFYSAVFTDAQQQTTRQHLKAIAEYIEQSAVETAPILSEALESLIHHINSLNSPSIARAIEQLNTTLYAIRVKPIFGKDWNEQLVMQHEALETAQAVRQLSDYLLQDIRFRQPDGSWAFEATKWQFAQRGDTVTITNKQDNREILRVEGDRPITFSPTTAEREKLKNFREQVNSDLQQQQQSQGQQQYQQRQRRPRL